MYKPLDIEYLINPDNSRILHSFYIKTKESSEMLTNLPRSHTAGEW